MASELLGRTACPECGFKAAHVKQKMDKEGSKPYRHCPDCGAQYFPRNTLQAENLKKVLRPENPAPEPTPTEPAPTEKRVKYRLGVAVPA